MGDLALFHSSPFDGFDDLLPEVFGIGIHESRMLHGSTSSQHAVGDGWGLAVTTSLVAYSVRTSWLVPEAINTEVVVLAVVDVLLLLGFLLILWIVFRRRR